MSLDLTSAPAATGRRPRWGTRTVVLLGVGSLTAGLLLTLFLWVDGTSYRHWPADAEVVAGAPAHEVAVEPGERFLLWRGANEDSPACAAVALPSGERVPLTPMSAGTRGGGAVPWVAFAEGRTDSARIGVSCTAPPRGAHDGPERSTYFADQADGPLLLDGLGPWWPAAAALLAVGIVLPAVGTGLARRR
ncbi:hypothetical protein [Nocardioides sp. LML1-1-1.1]|uniref:hypothetical protein n=1 Tax=Nocardioides sp. LML1-1-1.1 TaxID=3135248 RepID=UPI00344834CF